MKPELEELAQAWSGSEPHEALCKRAAELDLPCDYCAWLSVCVVMGGCAKRANEECQRVATKLK